MHPRVEGGHGTTGVNGDGLAPKPRRGVDVPDPFLIVKCA